VKIYHKAVLSAVGFCLYASLSSISLAQSLKSAISTTTPESISLEWALQQALINNNRLQLFSYDQRINEALAIQANLAPNPELGVEIENVFGTGKVSGVNRAQTTVALSQVIEMGDKRQRRVDLVSAKKRQQISRYEQQRMEVLSETAGRFYRVLRLQTLKIWLNEKLNIEVAALSHVEKRAKAGNVTQADVSKLLLRVTNTKLEVQTLDSNIALEKQRLAMMWSAEAKFAVVEGRLALTASLPKTTTVLNAIETTPEFMQLLSYEQVLKAKTRAEIAKGEYDIKLGLGVKRYEEFDDSALMLTFSMPITLTNANKGNILAAKQQENKILQQQKLARTQIRLTLLEVQQKLASNSVRVKSLKRINLPLAKQLLQDTEQAYNAGKVNVLQLLDAQNELFDIKRALIEAKFSVVMQLLELERITGQSMTQQFPNNNAFQHSSQLIQLPQGQY
jgi:cobalt-zinc-cadmium efflux system outer membrane protein